MDILPISENPPNTDKKLENSWEAKENWATNPNLTQFIHKHNLLEKNKKSD